MTNRRIHLPIVPVILVTVSLLFFVTSASPSQAARPETYHGKITRGTWYCNGEPTGYAPTVDGHWTLIIDPQTPEASLLTTINHRLGWVYDGVLILISHVDGVYMFSVPGDPEQVLETVTFDTRVTPARFSWHIEDRSRSCPDRDFFNSITFFGEALGNHR